MSEKRDFLIISLLGDQNVGKSCICGRFFGFDFMDNTVNTMGKDSMQTKKTMDDGNEIQIVVWDTAGQERFQSVSLSTINNSHGIIVTFEVTSRKSFNNVQKWLNQISDRTNKVAIVLFGNKCDMKDREVKKEEAEKFAEEHNLPYLKLVQN